MISPEKLETEPVTEALDSNKPGIVGRKPGFPKRVSINVEQENSRNEATEELDHNENQFESNFDSQLTSEENEKISSEFLTPEIDVCEESIGEAVERNEFDISGDTHHDGDSEVKAVEKEDEGGGGSETDQLIEEDFCAKIRENIANSESNTGVEYPPIVIQREERQYVLRNRLGIGNVLVGSAALTDLLENRQPDFLSDGVSLNEGVLFRTQYLGSTQIRSEEKLTRATRMIQAQEAVERIKVPPGEHQPCSEVDLFISTEKIMVLDKDSKEPMMDHALRTISYIADIGSLIVLMARRTEDCSEPEASSPRRNEDIFEPETSSVESDSTSPNSKSREKHHRRSGKCICHIFECPEAQSIAQLIGEAFQVAYEGMLEGAEEPKISPEEKYQQILDSQQKSGDELEMFAKKEMQREMVILKNKGEILGVSIVESGWGSMLPTVVIANLAPNGAAARCGQLNIGDQIIAINGMSLVGLPLSQCQDNIRNMKNQKVVKLTVVPCPPVVEVIMRRPNKKYQLGCSIQNGVVCSLLRGGIAERGGLRVGHRIIEINNQSVVAVPHEKIIRLLSTSVGEINIKTMPKSMYRLLTGQEDPIFN